MRLRRLALDDFGCFRGARAADVGDGLVVVGGAQRAGKTTFMRALRQFPDGVSRGNGLPPAADEYRVDAEVTHGDGAYRYVLDGHGAPRVTPLDGADPLDVDDIFDPVTPRQYRSLYTVSLDELRRLPPGIDDAEDLARVLLGGAYGDIADLPAVRERFADAAHDIGLSKGNPETTTPRLHAPYVEVTEGMAARREANQQVEEHAAVAADLESTRESLAAVEADIDEREAERDRLSVLRSEFDDVARRRNLRRDLDDADVEAAQAFPVERVERAEYGLERFEAATDALADAREAFEHEVDAAATDAYRATLLAHETRLESLERDLSGWEARVDAVRDTRERLDERRRDLEGEVADLHPEWDRYLSHLDDVDVSLLSDDRVAGATEAYEDLTGRLAEREETLEATERRLEGLHDQLADAAAARTMGWERGDVLRVGAVAAAAVAAAVAGSELVSTLVGAAAGALVLLVGLLVVRIAAAGGDAVPVQALRAQVSEKRAVREELASTVAELETQVDAAERDLAEVRDALGLPGTVSPDAVAEFYDAVTDLKASASDLRDEMEVWEADRDDLVAELRDAANTARQIREFDWDADRPLDGAEALFDAVRTAHGHLDAARDVAAAEREREHAVDDLDGVISAWDGVDPLDAAVSDETVRDAVASFREAGEEAAAVLEAVEERDAIERRLAGRFGGAATREAFAPVREDDDESWLAVLDRVAGEFVDAAAVEERLDAAAAALDDLRDRRQELDDERREHERRLDELASDDDLVAAQRRIDAGRVEFERLGERYAVNRIAESMVERLHDRFMAEVVESLVDEAGEIFAEITGEYAGVELGGELRDLEFRALRENGPDHGIGELSRATAEQLFLAVRVARIRQTGAELPVVLDDAMTNFDPSHGARVLRVVDELAATNQVFFLTCHPEFVDLTTRVDGDPQYWWLADGAFDGPVDAETLESRLHNGAT